MKINTKIKFSLLICFLISITLQFEDFGVFKTFTNDKKHNKTEDNNSTNILSCSNSTNSTNSTDENYISPEEPSKI